MCACFHFIGPPPGCDHTGVGFGREGQWDSSHLDPSNNFPPSKSSLLPSQNIPQKAFDTQKFVRISEMSACDVSDNVSSDLSLFDIEKDCQLNLEVYDISDLAQVSRSILTLPQSEFRASGGKKSPRPKKEKQKESPDLNEHLVIESKGNHAGSKQEYLPCVQQKANFTKEIKSAKSMSSETKPARPFDEDQMSKKLIVFNPEDLESDSTDSNQENDLPSKKNETSLDHKANLEDDSAQGLGKRKSAYMEDVSANAREISIGDQAKDQDIDIKNGGLNDSGKHDSLDSLLESSLFQTHRLSSIDDRKNRFESVESFGFSPLTPLSGSKMETKPHTYTFAFVNDSVWTSESSGNVETSEDDFDEIFNKAVLDLETSEKKSKPPRQRMKKSHKPSDSKKDLEKLAENVEDNEENCRSFQMEFGDDHEFRFSVDDIHASKEQDGKLADSVTPRIQKSKKNDDLSFLWRFEDDTVKDDYEKVFGSVPESYAQNRAFLRKAFAKSDESVSTESDALSVIQEEIDGSDQSNEELEEIKESYLHDIQEEDNSALLIEGTVELCVENDMQIDRQGSLQSDEKIVDDSEGIDENITLRETTGKLNGKGKTGMEPNSMNNYSIALDSSLMEQSSTDCNEQNMKDVKGSDNDHQKDISQNSAVVEKGVDEEKMNTESSLGKMLLASSKIALITLETSESPADRSITSTENLVSSLDAEICLDEEGSQTSEDLLLQQIIQSQNNSDNLSIQDSSPDSQTDKVRKRNKSKQLVQEWLQTDVQGEVMNDVPDDIPSPLLVKEWLETKVPEEIDPTLGPAPLSLPLSEGDQNIADSFPTTVPNAPVLQLEEHSGIHFVLAMAQVPFLIFYKLHELK